MILYRHNGETICLTPEEMREIWQEVETFDLRADVVSALNADDLAALSAEELNELVSLADCELKHNDAYYDAYWSSIRQAVREWRSNYGGNFQNDRPV